jgi:MSHA biogenesis protein MshJ
MLDRLSLRERVLVFLVIAGIIFAGCDTFLLRPLAAKQRQQLVQVKTLRGGIQILNEQTVTLANLRKKDPDAAARKQLAGLKAELKRLEGELRGLARNLVPPRDMAALLEAVLTRDADLRLVRLEGLGAESVLGTSAAPAQAGATNLYRHGLRIDFRGGYLETLSYLQALEALPWQVLWDSVAFEVQEYPSALITIRVYSLSLEGGWIGV